MKTANEVATKNIHAPNIKVLAVLDTKGELPSHVLIRRLDEGVLYKGKYTEKVYQVRALAIGVTLAGMAGTDQKESDWLMGFAFKREWLLAIAWHCFLEAVLGWLRRILRKEK